MAHSRPAISLLNYTVRISQRAKYVRLCLTLQEGLIVVVPRGFDTRRIPAIIREKQRWIERATARLHMQREVLATSYPETIPRQIALRALSEEWQVHYRTDPRIPEDRTRCGDLLLYLDSDTADLGSCRELLRRWLKEKAHTRLVPMLRHLSLAYNLPYADTSVRGQSTLWASCSARKNISLNYKLLFLPQELVRYVFVHELCHTRHLNHSQRFWTLVHSLEPGYQQIEKELRDAWRFIPPWVET